MTTAVDMQRLEIARIVPSTSRSCESRSKPSVTSTPKSCPPDALEDLVALYRRWQAG